MSKDFEIVVPGLLVWFVSSFIGYSMPVQYFFRPMERVRLNEIPAM